MSVIKKNDDERSSFFNIEWLRNWLIWFWQSLASQSKEKRELHHIKKDGNLVDAFTCFPEPDC